MDGLIWILAVALFFVAGSWHNSTKKYRKKLEEAEEQTTIIYEEIYVADKLTGFIGRLDVIAKAHKSQALKLPDCVSELRQITTIVERPQTQIGSRKPVVLKDKAAANELELLSNKRNTLKGR
jgi:hypothetical protein